MFTIKETDVTKGCKTFISLRDKMNIKYKFNSSSAHEFVSRYCSKLRVNDECTNLAKKIAINTQKLNVNSTTQCFIDSSWQYINNE